jgi:hypothetical protein
MLSSPRICTDPPVNHHGNRSCFSVCYHFVDSFKKIYTLRAHRVPSPFPLEQKLQCLVHFQSQRVVLHIHRSRQQSRLVIGPIEGQTQYEIVALL